MPREDLRVRVGADITPFRNGMDRAVGVAKNAAKRISMAVAGAVATSALVGAGFEQQLITTASVAGAYGKDLDRLEKKARQLGETTAFSASQAAKGMYDLASAGMTTAEIVDSVDAAMKLAGATGSQMAEATNVLTSTLKALDMQATESKRVTDTFAASITSSRMNMWRLTEGMKDAAAAGGALGWSVEETVAALTMFIERGHEGSRAGNLVRMSMTHLMKQTKPVKEVLNELNLSFTDVNPKTKTFGEILKTLATAGADAHHSLKLFGRTGMHMDVLIQQARKGGKTFEWFVEKFKKAQEGVGETNVMYDRIMTSLMNRFKILTSAMAELAITVFDLWKQDGKDLLGVLTDGVKKVASYIKDNADEFKELIKVVTRLLKIAVGAAGLYLIYKTLLSIKTSTMLATGAMHAYRMSILSAQASAVLLTSTLKTLFLVAGAGFAGWEIGKWLSEEFEKVRLASVALVDIIMKNWILMKYGIQEAIAVMAKSWNDFVFGAKHGTWSLVDYIIGLLEKVPFIGEKMSKQLKWSLNMLWEEPKKKAGEYDNVIKQIGIDKEKELAKHEHLIDILSAEALGYKNLTDSVNNYNLANIRKVRGRGKKEEERPEVDITDQVKKAQEAFKEAMDSQSGAEIWAEYQRERMKEALNAMMESRAIHDQIEEDMLRMSTDNKFEIEREHLDKLKEYYEKHYADKNAIEEWYKKKSEEISDKERQYHLNNLKGRLGDLAFFFKDMGSKSKTAFKAYQALSIAQATISGIQAAVAAWKAGMETGGPWAPVVAAAYAAASLARTAAMISQIASQSPSGAGAGAVSVGAVGTYQASPTTGLPEPEIEGDQRPKGDVNIYIQGDSINDEEYLERWAEKISEMVEDRDVRLIASESKLAGELA